MTAEQDHDGPCTWGALLEEARAQVGDDRIARWLLEEVSGLSPVELRVSLGQPAPSLAHRRLERMTARLEGGEPLQHVLGHWGFRTLDLAVGPQALVPRPETEVVVELALEELRRLEGRRVVDLGTGSGAIGLSIAAEEARAEVLATDLSDDALGLASANLAGLGAEVATRVRLLRGDWYGALPGEVAGTIDVVVSNPPYVAEEEWEQLDPVVRLHEPRAALVPGATGLEAIERVVAGAPSWLAPTGSLVVEIAPSQAEAALCLAADAGFGEAFVAEDLAGRQRVLLARRKPA